jgi:putative ABC transport system ATP-binding protein
MTVRLEKVIPLPLLEQETPGSGIWEADGVLFEQGKSYLVEAPSGKGKTSLLSIIYGLRNDFRGKVLLDGKDISGLGWKAWSGIRKKQLSFIFQGLELFDHLTAQENIELKNSITGHLPAGRISAMAEAMGIAPFLNKKAGILSFGQQQRVAVIRALCQPFQFLLADECFSHMDRENRALAFGIIQQECKAQGAGLILTALNDPGHLETDERWIL